MKDERIGEITANLLYNLRRQGALPTVVATAIRLALAERDAEIVDFARHEARVGEIDGWVSVADLLAFLKEGKA